MGHDKALETVNKIVGLGFVFGGNGRYVKRQYERIVTEENSVSGPLLKLFGSCH